MDALTAGSWLSAPTTLGGEVAEDSSPAAVSNPAGTVYVISYVNKSGEIAYFGWNEKWSGPTTLGGSVKADTSPAGGMWESGENFIFM